MEKEEKFKLAIERGYSCDAENGIVFGSMGKELKGTHHSGYKVIKLKYPKSKKSFQISQHQFIYYITYGEIVDCIDHINGIKDDNRICNLRSVTNQQNCFNTKAKGYYFHKNTNKWRAHIGIDNKRISLGYFNTEEEAKQAYLKAKELYHII